MRDADTGARIDRLTYAGSKLYSPRADYSLVFAEKGSIDYRTSAERGILSEHEAIASRRGCGIEFALGPDAKAFSLSMHREFAEMLASLHDDRGTMLSVFPGGAGQGGESGSFIAYAAGESSGRIKDIFDEAEEETEYRKPFSDCMILAKITELLVLLLRSVPGDAKIRCSHAIETRDMNGIIAYIEAHYSEEFSLADLSSMLGLTPSYFSRVFHSTTGMPLFEYINTIRIRKACALLKRTDMSILDIAYAVGYNNLSFFNRYFRKIMNTSPREYKRLK